MALPSTKIKVGFPPPHFLPALPYSLPAFLSQGNIGNSWKRSTWSKPFFPFFLNRSLFCRHGRKEQRRTASKCRVRLRAEGMTWLDKRQKEQMEKYVTQVQEWSYGVRWSKAIRLNPDQIHCFWYLVSIIDRGSLQRDDLNHSNNVQKWTIIE